MGIEANPIIRWNANDEKLEGLIWDGYELIRDEHPKDGAAALEFLGKTDQVVIRDHAYINTERAILFHRLNLGQKKSDGSLDPRWHDGPAIRNVEIENIFIDGCKVTNRRNDQNTGEMILFHGMMGHGVGGIDNTVKDVSINGVFSALPSRSYKAGHALIQLYKMNIDNVHINNVVAPNSAINVWLTPQNVVDELSMLNLQVKGVNMIIDPGASAKQIRSLRLDDDYPVRICLSPWRNVSWQKVWEFDHIKQAHDCSEVP
jgi:hypothetical protein